MYAGGYHLGSISRLLRPNRRKVGSDQEQCSDIEGQQPQSTNIPLLQYGEREPRKSDKQNSEVQLGGYRR